MKARYEELELNQDGNSVTSELKVVEQLKFGSSNRRKKYIIAVVLVLVLAAAVTVGLVLGLPTSKSKSSVGTTKPYRPVLLVSLDGFRPSYLTYNVTPHIQQLIREGVHTPRMLPVYPTLTFPNHYTIVTGLYPESHGIVDNKMFDANFQRLYSLGSPEASKPRWYGGEPIWLTVKRQGKKSACYFWVGSDVKIAGEFPNEYRKYNTSVPFSERVDTVLGWLTSPADTRPDLITLYFNEPDHTGHIKGPGPTPEMLEALRTVDGVVGQLVKGLKDHDLYNSVNLLLVADHGMSERSCDRQVKLIDFFNRTELSSMYVYSSASGRIGNTYRYTRPNFTVLDTPSLSSEEIVRRASGHLHMALYPKAQLPKRLHYANNIRIDDVVVKMDDHWVVSRYGSSGPQCSGGTHGWDSRYDTMGALFVGRGPAFKEGVEVPPFENIELYNLMADLLEVAPAPNNGTQGSLYSLLKKPPALDSLTKNEIQCQHVTDLSVSKKLQNYCNCSAAEQNTSQPHVSGILQPVLPNSQSSLCLSDDHHKTMYSTQLHMPLWTSFTVSNEQDILQDKINCIVPEDQLPSEEQGLYSVYTNSTTRADGVTAAAFFTSPSSCGRLTRSSNVIPMMEKLKDDLWEEVWFMLREVVAKSHSPVDVILGPVFDYDFDGLADNLDNITRYADTEGKVALPSHYFVVLARCPQTDQPLLQCIQQLDVLSFLLPNQQNLNAQTGERRLLENVARLRDVELLTGLQFFPDLDPAVSARLRTHVPTALWVKPGVWTDDLCTAPSPSKCTSSYKPVVLISLDGFRADYLVKYNRTPTIDRLIRCGVHAPYMRSVYPTVTFPNHYTIVTGLYPESHGIIDNDMYDMDMGQKFCLSCPQLKNPSWWGGEPLWLTAKRQGHKTATCFWPGSDVPIQGEYPNLYLNYSGGVSFMQRVFTVLQWLKLPEEERPDFITLYFDEPDHTGHQVGPDSPLIGEKLAEVDRAIDELMQALYLHKMHHCANIIIVADHGMSGLSCDRVVSLSGDLSKQELRNMYVYEGPVGRISNKYKYCGSNNCRLDPPRISDDAIIEKLECSNEHMRVYSKASLPLRHHYTNNDRIDDVLLDADDQWLISRTESSKSCSGGNHGYDNLYASMHALFVAHGPAFKSGVEVEPFENIELYNLMADLIGVTPAPNNGTEGSLFNLLRKPPTPQPEAHKPRVMCRNNSETLVDHQRQQDACGCSQVSAPVSGGWSSPLGEPVSQSDGPTLCITNGSDFTLAYDSDMASPAWIAFNVNVTNSTDVVSLEAPCILKDTWMQPDAPDINTTLLEGTGYVPVSLKFSLNKSCSVAMASEVVPMLAAFRDGTWKKVEQMVADYSVQFGKISVTVGPVYNDDATAVWKGRTNKTRLIKDTFPVPTHFFVVLGKCASAEQSLPCWESLDLLSFLIPHVDMPSNCQYFSAMLRENVARLKDVEIATGLHFFSQLPISQAARLQTFLPTKVWDGSPLLKPKRWVEQECPWKEEADNQCPTDYKPVLLISLDGFRADYLVKYNRTPTIDRLIRCGVHAPYMRSVYPTVTFPNHYTIVTGLYPESHGIISNNMYDSHIADKFCLSCDQSKNPAWWGGEPIWLTAKKQGHKTATYFWPGSEVAIEGEYPDMYFNYSGGVSYTKRVNTVLNWLRLPVGERPDYITLYFDEPDHTGHLVGPDSPQIAAKLEEVDSHIGDLMQGLYQDNLHHCVNIILIADHGMSGISCDRVISLAADISKDDLRKMYVYDGAVGRISNKYSYGRVNNSPINPPQINISTIVEKLECSDSHMRVYTKASLPLRHHYTNNDRIDDIVLDSDDQWLVARTTSRYCTGGTHGYDNLYASMHALFVAHGPAFKSGVEVEPFENIELYNLMADLVGVTPAPNNGTEGSLFNLLRKPPTPQAQPHKPSLQCSNDTDGVVMQQKQQDMCGCSQASSAVSGGWSSPLGEPVSQSDGPTLCITNGSDFTLAYDSDMASPAWIAFTVNVTNSTDAVSSALPCVVRDPWMQSGAPVLNTTVLEGMGYVPGSLRFDLGNSCSAAMASEIVPMMAEFKTGMWREVEQLVADYSVQYGQISVTVGPVYNDDVTAVWKGRTNNTRLVQDTFPVPTHFFVVLGKCASAEQTLPCWESLELLSFLVPHAASPTNCQSFGAMLRENVARVRDVEIATGLRFFSNLTITQAARLRTFLPTKVWDGSTLAVTPRKPGNWSEQACPPKDKADRQCPNDYQPVLMVSLDGFKPQYLGRGFTPVMDRLVSCGVHAPYMRSVYPTKTFPNHYSIVTGLYPESHGIIDNNMFDFNVTDEKFKIYSDVKNNPGWWGGEPIWITAKKQNVTSATYFWVGSDVKIQGTYPDIFKYYSEGVPYSSRVSTVVEWMRLPKERRPDLLLLYFDQPDHQAHTSGPFTPEVDKEIARVDTVLGELMDSLYQHDLHHCVNVIILSDHGFSSVSCDKVIELNNYFTREEKDNLYFYLGAFARISNTYASLKNGSLVRYDDNPPMSIHDVQEHLQCVNQMQVYAKTDLPKRHHYVNNDRIDNIILDPTINWTVADKLSKNFCTGGSHGWDNTYKAMEALFVGYGPAFKNGETVKPFENIELYNMISDLLGIQPTPNNGTEGSLDHLLWKTFNREQRAAATYIDNLLTAANVTVTATCNCSLETGRSMDSISQALTSVNKTQVKQRTLPYGAPLLMTSEMKDVVLLYQPTFVTAYSANRSLPLWISASVSPSMLKGDNLASSCAVEDPRITDSQHQQACQNLQQQSGNVTYRSLLPLEYNMGVTSSLLSSQVPIHNTFYAGVWRTLQRYVGNWSMGYQELNIMAGTAFDVDSDGLADTLADIHRTNLSVPTHIFLIASRCQNASQLLGQCSSIQTLSFILPQVDTSKPFNCQTPEEYLIDNEARVRDVELITELQFFPDLLFSQAVAMRTYLPSGLWPL
ncbi:uncharacterized protein [Littorina saxatilis]|uniref:Ectonucleotide pyrophosphatase/phosphodiesterase family member 3 n=1 Tax=Littorina saxatilis TaxID=31220 RepID=A0AAN9GAR6_9CAEN